MKTEISNAIDSHNLWKIKLVDAINMGSMDRSVEEIKSDSKCAFGHWLYGEELSNELKKTVGYERVKQLHIEFHHIAARIAELAIYGDTEAALNLLHDTEYSEATMNLNNALYYLDKLM